MKREKDRKRERTAVPVARVSWIPPLPPLTSISRCRLSMGAVGRERERERKKLNSILERLICEEEEESSSEMLLMMTIRTAMIVTGPSRAGRVIDAFGLPTVGDKDGDPKLK